MALSPATVRIECTLSNGSVTALNVWHGVTSASGAPTVTDSQTLVDRLQTFYNALAGQFAIGTIITVGSKVVAIGQNPPTFVATTPRSVSGTLAGDALPFQTCLTLRLRTVDATRRGRGHVYLWPFTESQNSATVPSPALTGAINTAAAGLISSPSTALPSLVVLSRIGSGSAVNPNPYTTNLSSAVSSTQWSVLRSRRR